MYNQEYHNELFAYKYRPKLLTNVKRPITHIFNKIVDSDTIPNIIIYGLKGSGKKTLLYAFLNSKYNIKKTRCTYREFKINTKKVTIPIFHSSMHIEIDVHTFLSHVRLILPVLIKEFAQTKNILCNKHKLFIIHHIECLEMQTQHTLRRILELYMDNCRFIFMTSKLNKVTKPLQSRCYIIKIPMFTKIEIKEILINIRDDVKKINYITDKEIIHITNNNNNLKFAIFELESKVFNLNIDINYKLELKTILDKIINIKKVDLELYQMVDDYLYKNLYKNISLENVIHYTFIELKTILCKKKDYIKLNIILDKFILYDLNMINGSRDYIHIQSIFYYLIYLFLQENK